MRRIGDVLVRNATVALTHPENTDRVIPDRISCSLQFLQKIYCWCVLLTLIMSWKKNMMPTVWLYVMSALWHRQQAFHERLPWLEAVYPLNIREEHQMRGGGAEASLLV